MSHKENKNENIDEIQIKIILNDHYNNITKTADSGTLPDFCCFRKKNDVD